MIYRLASWNHAPNRPPAFPIAHRLITLRFAADLRNHSCDIASHLGLSLRSARVTRVIRPCRLSILPDRNHQILSDTHIPALDPNTVHVWRIPLDYPPATISRLEQALSAAELERAHRCVNDTDRQRFIASHAALRSILGHYLNRDRASIELTVQPGGKPALAESNASTLQFNLTRSHALGMVAITAENQVGIDVEKLRSNFDIASIVKRFFSQNETAKWQQLPHEEKAAAFFRCWTRKEAYMKARGTALSLALDQIDLPFGLDEIAGQLAPHDEPSNSTPRWYFRDVSPNTDYVAACVVEQGTDRVLDFDWNVGEGNSD